MPEIINISNRRILVVDDNHAIHEDFRKILCAPENEDALAEQEAELFGEPEAKPSVTRFQIDSAMQGREGLQRVEQSLAAGQPYAMAFVDVRMPPGWDGIETTVKIWEVYPDLQVVICTAYSDYSWDDMIAKVGQSDRLVILKKPFDNIEVLQLANALTAKWELLQQAKSKLEDLEHVIAERTAAFRESEQHYREMDENGRFLKSAFVNLDIVLRSHGELLQAAKAANLSPAIIARGEDAIQKTDLEHLGREIPNALDQLLNGIERVGKSLRATNEFSQKPLKDHPV